MCVLSGSSVFKLYFNYYYFFLFLYSEAHVHTLIACVRDALEQQNSGTAVNDRYMKLTLINNNHYGSSVESHPSIDNDCVKLIHIIFIPSGTQTSF